MEARLYIHIGPPKTATSALQHALQNVQLENLVYGGVFQPREKNASSLASRLALYTGGWSSLNDPSVTSAIDEIKEIIASQKSVFISEEMFLLAEWKCSFTEKLSKLSTVFNATPTTILFTVRNPLDGLPSLYQELFRSLPLAQQLSFRKFCASEAAQCFDYQRILADLSAVGFEDIRVVDFARITGGELRASDLFGSCFENQASLKLATMNVGKKSKTGRTLPRISLMDLVRRLPLRTFLSKVAVGRYLLADAGSNLLDCVTIRREEVRNLRVPSNIAKRLQANYHDVMELYIKDQACPSSVSDVSACGTDLRFS